MPLPFKVTTAGRAALVNAENTGTLPVTVTQVGVTATAFTAAADGSDLALPGELKRLATFGGAAVAADTIHAVIRDDSADVYTLRGFALYLADGTIFGLYGQAAPILEKSAAAMMLLASDIIFADIDAASLVFGDTSFLNPPATVDTAGVVKLATEAETITGVDGTRAVTPKGLLAKITDLLGAGAPSTFVKSLLTAVDKVAFRTLLAIKSAASYDIGVGNGLDADMLDGQHGAYYRAWSNLTGIPDTFTPSTHQHSAADITSGLLAVARGGTGAGTFAAGSYLIGNGTSAFAAKTPAQVLADIGAAPVAHSHAISNVNGLEDTLDGLSAAIATKQPNLGFVPVRQGGGVGQQNNVIKIGYDGLSKVKVTVDGTDFGGIAFLSGAAFTGGISAPLLDVSGCNIRWNIATIEYGETSFVNNRGGGGGGFAWFNRATANDPVGAPIMTLGSGGNLTASGGISCVTMNASSSDIRLKFDVKTVDARPLHRLLAELPDTHGALSTYIHKADHKRHLGPIAQDMERVERAYMGTIDISEGQVEGVEAGTYKTVDKASAAYEQAMWSGQEIDRLHDIIGQLQERLSLLESR